MRIELEMTQRGEWAWRVLELHQHPGPPYIVDQGTEPFIHEAAESASIVVHRRRED